MPLPFRGLRTSSRACSLFGSQRAGWIDPGGFAGCHPASGNSDGSEHSDRDPKGGRIPRLDLEQDTAQQTIERQGCAESGGASDASYLRGFPYDARQSAAWLRAERHTDAELVGSPALRVRRGGEDAERGTSAHMSVGAARRSACATH